MDLSESLPAGNAGENKRRFRIALIGNPNCGKTTIFNEITGTHQHVGNYPGVTVESKTGNFSAGEYAFEIIDLPGIYSLSATSPEEQVAFDELTAGKIDLIVNIINSAALQRNLYLTTQVAELHVPMLLAFNMSDEAEQRGYKFDLPALEKALGSPIVKTVGNRRGGAEALVKKIVETCEHPQSRGLTLLRYGEDVDDEIAKISAAIAEKNPPRFAHIPPKFFALKLLENDPAVTRLPEFSDFHEMATAQIKHLSGTHAIDSDTFIADRRYALISGICRQTIEISEDRRQQISDQIDNVVTNRLLGLPLFFFTIYLVFWFTFTVGDPLMTYIETAFTALQDLLKTAWGNENFVQRLVIEGVIGGVGGVIVFLPNIVLMFLALAFLEDSGYMARAAFVVDGIMRKFGLHGKSFIPLILGFGCSVPAIMATRSIESERDRKATIMVLPLMSCGARLPIHVMIIAAFFSQHAAGMMFTVYLIGVLIAMFAALLLKKTLFSGGNEIYLLELPPYRLPTLRGMLIHAWERAAMYLRKAGTIILAVSIVLFIANTFPQKTEIVAEQKIENVKTEFALTDAQIELLATSPELDEIAKAKLRAERFLDVEEVEQLAAFDRGESGEKNVSPELSDAIAQARDLAEKTAYWTNEAESEKLEYTLAGRVGQLAEPIFRPLGFDWKISTAMIGALAAKEVFVSQLGILYSTGEADEESESLRSSLQENYTPLQGFAIMIFCLLSIPCVATLAIIRRELNSWKYAIAEAVGLFSLAYVATLIIYQVGSFLQIGVKLL